MVKTTNSVVQVIINAYNEINKILKGENSLVYQLVAMVILIQFTLRDKHSFLGSGKVAAGEHCTGFFPGEIPVHYDQIESVLMHLPWDDRLLSFKYPIVVS